MDPQKNSQPDLGIPRCIQHIRREKISDPSAYLGSRGEKTTNPTDANGMRWIFEDLSLDRTKYEFEVGDGDQFTTFYLLGLNVAGEACVPMAHIHAKNDKKNLAPDDYADPIYLQFPISENPYSTRSLIFHQAWHGYHSEYSYAEDPLSNNLVQQHTASGNATAPSYVECRHCLNNKGIYKEVVVTFIYANFTIEDYFSELESAKILNENFEPPVPIENLFDSFYLIGTCDQCEKKSLLFEQYDL